MNLPKFDPPSAVKVYRNLVNPSSLNIPVVAKPFLFPGEASINAHGISYEGPAELYLSGTAIYLKYGDSWLNWKTANKDKTGKKERFNGKGETGSISVILKSNDQGQFQVSAKGTGFIFQGKAL